jgi:hypothetical protein
MQVRSILCRCVFNFFLYSIIFSLITGTNVCNKANDVTCCHAVRLRPPTADTSEQRWNYADRGKPKHSEKNVSQCHFVPQKSTWTDVGTNPAVRNEKLATNCKAPAHTDCAVTKYISCTSLNIEHIKEVKWM